MLSPNEVLAIVPRYMKRHLSLQDFAAPPCCRFYRIRVPRYSLVSMFQHVEDLLLDEKGARRTRRPR